MIQIFNIIDNFHRRVLLWNCASLNISASSPKPKAFTRAARRLNMSQPPLGYQLKQLEAELNVTLFERTRQGVRLTEAGKLLYDRSANLLEVLVKSTELEVAKVGKSGFCASGITPTTVATIMPCVSLFPAAIPMSTSRCTTASPTRCTAI